MHYGEERTKELTERVARILGGATVETEGYAWRGIVKAPEGVELVVEAFTGDRGAVSLAYGSLGRYISHYSDDSTPKATFAMSRPDAAIAGDIRRKVITPGLEVIAELTRRKENEEAYLRAKTAAAEKIAGAMGVDPAPRRSDGRPVYYGRTAGDHSFTATVEGPDSVSLDLSLPLDEAVEIIRLLTRGAPDPCPDPQDYERTEDYEAAISAWTDRHLR